MAPPTTAAAAVLAPTSDTCDAITDTGTSSGAFYPASTIVLAGGAAVSECQTCCKAAVSRALP